MPDLLSFSRRSFLVMPLALAACNRSGAVFSLSGQTMGTMFSVVAIDDSRDLGETEISTAVQQALAEVNAQMSNWDAASEISRFNATDGTGAMPMSPALADVMDAAELVHLASDGRFDTTMGPLIELWGFGAPGAAAMPGDAQIADTMRRVGHARTLTLGNGLMQKQQADARVYLAAIGKGYGADHVGRALEAMGISNYMVEIGGDIFASGRNPDGLPWQIGVENPTAFSGGVFSVVGLSGMGLASSGDYRNFFEQDGQRYSHLIDPVTGRPVEHQTASATVLAENAMLADAWSTAMLILGRDRGLEIAEANDIAVMFIDRDGSGADIEFSAASSARFDLLTG